MASTLETLLLAMVQNLTNNSPQQIGETALTGTAASITITIPSGYTHLEAVWTARSDTAATATNAVLRFNGDGGNNYLWQQVETNVSTTTGTTSGALTGGIHIGAMPAASATASYFGKGTFSVGNISGTTFKVAEGKSTAYVTTTNSYIGTYGGQWNSTSAITSVTLLPVAGNFVAGTVLTIFGMK